MKIHCLYFGIAYAIIALICYWIAIGQESLKYDILAIALSFFTLALFWQYRKDIKDEN